jgi:uncharacterized membrane protein YkvA (DUF1232 family)
MATSDHTVGFEPADRLAEDPESVRRRFWIKLKQVAAKLPFAEDLLAAYYCAFDKQTPRHVQASLLGAVAYFILPFDFMPDVLPVLGFTDDAAVLATAIRMVAGHITQEHRDAARAALKRGIKTADVRRIAEASVRLNQTRSSGFPDFDALTLRRRRLAGLRPWRFRSASQVWNCLNSASLSVPSSRSRPSPGSASGTHRTWRGSRLRRCGS